MINTIIDVYHKNDLDLQKILSGGVIAIIHKATEGAHIVDRKYADRKKQAKGLGFLWGAYHFSSGENVADQVANFLNSAQPEDEDLVSLDWEPGKDSTMTLDQARNFVQLIKSELGRWPVLYGGHLLRESVGHAPDPILANCPLWYARYASSPIGIPTQIWTDFTLWQYSDGNVGPEPHDTAGASGADRNIFSGTTQQLRSAWPFTRKAGDAKMAPGFAAIIKSKKPVVRRKKRK